MSSRLTVALNVRRAVLGWLVLGPALIEMDAFAELSPSCKESFNQLQTWLAGRCAAQLMAVDDATTVDDFIVRLANSFGRQVGELMDGAPDSEQGAANHMATHLARCAAGFEQSRCDLLEPPDAWAREVTASCYERRHDAVSVSTIRDRLEEVPTLLKGSKGPPPSAAAPWSVYTATRFPPDGGPASQVEWTLGLPLPVSSWYVASYLLLHELVSHVAQGPWDSACRKPAADDLYAEGWMDYVAWALHTIYLNGGGSVAEGVDYELPDEPYLRSEAGRMYHLERSRLRKLGNRMRCHGASVAARLDAHMRRGRADPVDETFLELSLHLNASTASHSERRRFVLGVDRGLADDAPLDDWLAAYKTTGSLDLVLAPLLELVEEETAGRKIL